MSKNKAVLIGSCLKIRQKALDVLLMNWCLLAKLFHDVRILAELLQPMGFGAKYANGRLNASSGDIC